MVFYLWFSFFDFSISNNMFDIYSLWYELMLRNYLFSWLFYEAKSFFDSMFYSIYNINKHMAILFNHSKIKDEQKKNICKYISTIWTYLVNSNAFILFWSNQSSYGLCSCWRSNEDWSDDFTDENCLSLFFFSHDIKWKKIRFFVFRFFVFSQTLVIIKQII